MKKGLLFMMFGAIISFHQLHAQCDIGGIFIESALLDPNSATNNFDTDGDGTAETEDEFVQLCNSSGSAIDLSSYTLGDDEGVVPLSGILTAGSCIVIMRNFNPLPTPVGQNFLIISSFAQLANGGEPLILSDGISTCTVAFGVPCDATPNCTQWPEDTDGIVTSGGVANPSITPASLGHISTLPIKLLSFTATTKNNQTHLNWATASELNNDYMAIEHSSDGKYFSEIGRIQGAGSTTETQEYSFIDTNPVKGINYYRLRQVDFDGHTEYHKIVSVTVNGKQGNISIAPTSVQDEVMVYFPEVLSKTANINIYDMSGRLWASTSLGITNKQAAFQLAHLPAGHYVLQLVDEQEVYTARFNKL